MSCEVPVRIKEELVYEPGTLAVQKITSGNGNATGSILLIVLERMYQPEDHMHSCRLLASSYKGFVIPEFGYAPCMRLTENSPTFTHNPTLEELEMYCRGVSRYCLSLPPQAGKCLTFQEWLGEAIGQPSLLPYEGDRLITAALPVLSN